MEKTVDNVGKIASGIITGADLVGGKPPMTDEDRQKALQEDEKMKQAAVAGAMASQGRDVEGEIEEVRKEKEKKEEEEERFLKNLEIQRENERIEREQMQAGVPGNAKKEAAKHQGQRGHKKQAPDPASMSATNEMTGGKID